MPNVVRLTSKQLMYAGHSTVETYYYTIDTCKLYRDSGNTNGLSNTNRYAIEYIFVETEKQRINEITPRNGNKYYVWETNELWTYIDYWILIAGSSDNNKSYYHGKAAVINSLDTGYEDNNGLLADGSVVIRDAYKNIKGRIFTDLATNDIVLSSFVGGGFRFLPYGVTDTITSLPDPTFRYKVYDTSTSEHMAGEFVLDEYGNKIIESITQVPDYNPSCFGKLAVDINNQYDSNGAVTSKQLQLNLSDTLDITQDYVYRGSSVSKTTDLIATAFNASTVYTLNDYCTKDGKLYRCIVASRSGAWNDNHFTESGLANKTIYTVAVATAFDTSTTYYRGDYCLYSGHLYKCNVTSYTGSWNADKFTDCGANTTGNIIYTIIVSGLRWYWTEQLSTTVTNTSTFSYATRDEADAEANKNAYWKAGEATMNFHGNFTADGHSGIILTDYQLKEEIVTAVSASSDDNHYPTAKAVYDAISSSGSGTKILYDSTTQRYYFETEE